jgi:hypothetical protein
MSVLTVRVRAALLYVPCGQVSKLMRPYERNDVVVFAPPPAFIEVHAIDLRVASFSLRRAA